MGQLGCPFANFGANTDVGVFMDMVRREFSALLMYGCPIRFYARIGISSKFGE